MEIKQGMYIRSTTAMNDFHFKNTLILITRVDKSGIVGFILNQPFGRNLNDLAEFSHSQPFPLHTGGPVDQEHLYFIHRQPLLISGGQQVAGDVYLGGNFGEVINAINAGLLTADDITIFVGYCGWDAVELEAETEEGSWEIVTCSAGNVFSMKLT